MAKRRSRGYQSPQNALGGNIGPQQGGGGYTSNNALMAKAQLAAGPWGQYNPQTGQYAAQLMFNAFRNGYQLSPADANAQAMAEFIKQGKATIATDYAMGNQPGSPVLGSYKKGTSYVPQTGNYLLHQGEAVISNEQAALMREKISQERDAYLAKLRQQQMLRQAGLMAPDQAGNYSPNGQTMDLTGTGSTPMQAYNVPQDQQAQYGENYLTNRMLPEVTPDMSQPVGDVSTATQGPLGDNVVGGTMTSPGNVDFGAIQGQEAPQYAQPENYLTTPQTPPVTPKMTLQGINQARAGGAITDDKLYEQLIKQLTPPEITAHIGDTGNYLTKTGQDSGVKAGVAAGVIPAMPTGLANQDQTAQPGQRNEAALEGLTEGQSAMVKKMADYKMPLPMGFSWKDPNIQNLLGRVAAYDPSFDATQYNTRMKLRGDFTSGKSAGNIRSLNTAVAHLDTLANKADDLNNAGLPLWNTISNYGLTQTGDPRVTNFNNAATAVESELANVFKGTGASDQEIKAWRNNLSSSQSPTQLKEGIQTAINLMGGRLGALQAQYEAGMGKPASFSMLSPKSRQILEKLGVNVDQFDSSGQTQGPAQTPQTATATPSSGLEAELRRRGLLK